MDIYYAYQKGAHALRSLCFHLGYICRGDTKKVGETISARSRQIEDRVQELFRHADVHFAFSGSAELVDLFRRVEPSHLKLRFLEFLSRENSYLLVVTLKEFAKFVTDDKGELKQDLFDSNVRDFMGLNPVNRDIRSTLLDADAPEFWWLNNGITMLVTEAAVVGKEVLLADIQIVNGLQTTECIFRHFKEEGDSRNNGSVLVRVIQSSDDSVRDAIIRSTNNQTTVEGASLYATDRIQRDIEEVLRPHGLRYERRKNHYVNRSVSAENIVTPLYLGAGYVALGLKNPVRAQSFGNDVIRNEVAYQTVFLHNQDIQIWVVLAHMLKFTDRVLHKVARQRSSVGRFVRCWRHVASFVYMARSLGGLGYSVGDVSELSISSLDEVLMQETVTYLVEKRARSKRLKRWNEGEFSKILGLASYEFDLGDTGEWRPGSWRTDGGLQPTLYEENLAMKVNQQLPDQPWKPGIHKQVSKELRCSVGAVSKAINLLVRRGIRYQQHAGIVCDSEGFVVAVDRERVGDVEMKSLRWRETRGEEEKCLK